MSNCSSVVTAYDSHSNCMHCCTKKSRKVFFFRTEDLFVRHSQKEWSKYDPKEDYESYNQMGIRTCESLRWMQLICCFPIPLSYCGHYPTSNTLISVGWKDIQCDRTMFPLFMQYWSFAHQNIQAYFGDYQTNWTIVTQRFLHFSVQYCFVLSCSLCITSLQTFHSTLITFEGTAFLYSFSIVSICSLNILIEVFQILLSFISPVCFPIFFNQTQTIQKETSKISPNEKDRSKQKGILHIPFSFIVVEQMNS